MDVDAINDGPDALALEKLKVRGGRRFDAERRREFEKGGGDRMR